LAGQYPLVRHLFQDERHPGRPSRRPTRHIFRVLIICGSAQPKENAPESSRSKRSGFGETVARANSTFGKAPDPTWKEMEFGPKALKRLKSLPIYEDRNQIAASAK
jgi:hypothetical protein